MTKGKAPKVKIFLVELRRRDRERERITPSLVTPFIEMTFFQHQMSPIGLARFGNEADVKKLTSNLK